MLAVACLQTEEVAVTQKMAVVFCQIARGIKMKDDTIPKPTLYLLNESWTVELSLKKKTYFLHGLKYHQVKLHSGTNGLVVERRRKTDII